MRAYLIVRAGSAAALDAASASGADALVVDVVGSDASAASSGAAGIRRDGRRLLVRVGSIDGPSIDADLSAAWSWRPDAVVLPVAHGRDVAHLGARLAVLEAETGAPDGATRIVALIAGAAGALNGASLAGASPRLVGVGWDGGAMADALGAPSRTEAGGWSAPLDHVRSIVRLAAAAARVEAIDTAYAGDEDGLARHCAAARRDGFGAVFAMSAAQAALIREA